MTAFFAAEPEEASALREALGAGEALEEPAPLPRGEGVLVADTGVGKVAAALVVAHVLTRFRPSESFFLGVAGALDPSLRALDLLLAEKQGNDRKGADHADHDQRQKYPDAFNKPVHD